MRVFHSHAKRISAPAVLAMLLSTTILCGCSTVGVTSIDQGRTPYNEVIQDTSKQQTLLNIVRVMNGESPLFMDVTEVDQATTVQGMLTGGASSIGASANPRTTTGTFGGVLGALTGTASYAEAPTVRYQPLTGQALIAQVSTPLSAESIANLTNSDWDAAALLTLSIDRITPGYRDYYPAVNALVDLQNYGAIIIAATKSSEADKQAMIAGLKFSTGPEPAKDTLAIYFEPKGIHTSQAACDGLDENPSDAKLVVNALWERLKRIYNPKNPNIITIQSRGSASLSSKNSMPPYLATRSALGILKFASDLDGSPTIKVIDEEDARRVIEDYKRRSKVCLDPFYTLDPKVFPLNPFEQPSSNPDETARIYNLVSSRVRERELSAVTLYPTTVNLSFDQISAEQALANSRKFMLIVRSNNPPKDAFVSVHRGEDWYSILEIDSISKRTLALINQFNTIQAIPSQSPALTPTISVGAR